MCDPVSAIRTPCRTAYIRPPWKWLRNAGQISRTLRLKVDEEIRFLPRETVTDNSQVPDIPGSSIPFATRQLPVAANATVDFAGSATPSALATYGAV